MRTARLGTVLALLATSVVATGAPVLAHGAVDQTTDGTPDAPCSAEAFPGTNLVTLVESRQSFVPSRGGLSSIEVCVQNFVGIPGTDVTVRVYEGGTATRPGTQVAAVPVDVGADRESPQWLHVDLPVEVPTTAGAPYVLGLQPAVGPLSAVSFKWRATCGYDLQAGCGDTDDTYPHGATNDLPANADYAFRTYPLHPADLLGDVDVDPVVCPGLDLTGPSPREGHEQRAAGTVTNEGATSVGPFTTQWRLSPDPVLDDDDLAIAGGTSEVTEGLAPDESVTIPPPPAMPGPEVLTTGPWYLLLHVDAGDTVVESTEDNNVAAALTTVTECGQPAIEDLALHVAEDRVPTGLRSVAAADLPIPDLAQGLPQTFAEAEETVQTSPYGFSPVGFSPVGFSPVGFSPVGFSPVGFSPVGFSPVGFSPVGFSPVGFSPLSQLLDDLPSSLLERILVVNVPVVGAGWEQRLAGLIGDRPVQDVTLREAAALLPDLVVQDVDLRAVLEASWLSVALANGALDDTPLPDGTAWCTWFASQGFDCASAGIDPATDSLLAAEAAGAPVRDAPIGDLALEATNRNPGWLVQAMPLTGSPRAHLEMTRLGSLSPAEALVDPDSVVDCAAFDCDQRPLAEAVTADALRPVDVGTLVAGLGPVGLATTTLTDLALLVADLASLDLGNMRWTLADPYRVDPTCTPMTYHLTGTNTGTGAVAPEAAVTLAPGFGYVPGSATLVLDGQDAIAQPEPTVTRAADGARMLTFPLEGTITSTFDLAFRACANVYLGHQAVGHATLSGMGIEGRYDAATDPAVADLVQVVEVSEEDGPTDTPDTAQPVAANDVVALHLQSADDVDFLEVPVPATPDSLTIVRVFPPPTVDADLFAHGPAQSPFGFSPVGFSPVGFSPVGFSPVGFSPYGFSPFGFSDAGAPVNGESDTAQPDTLDDVPTHLAPSDTSGLRAISANRGDQPETVYLRNHDGDDGVFTIGVSGYNGVRSDAPVVVTIQQVAPTPDPALEVCAPAPWDLQEAAGQAPAAWSGDQPPRTLLVTNRQVAASTHGAAAADDGIAALHELAARPEVRGIVLQVDHVEAVRQAYADWRADWCSPTAANVAASHVRAEILRLRAQHPTIDTVVLAGGDEILPDFRLVDTSLLANESQYSDSLVRAHGANTALVAAYARGTIPSADPYGTSTPTVYGQSFAYTPDAGVSRLVETPADWVAQVDAYLAAGGLLDPQDAAISAYDGMVDGASAAAEVLTSRAVATTLLTDDAGPWSADQFRAAVTTPGPDLAGYNAHANHWALLSALGSAEPGRGDAEVVTSAEQAGLPFGGIVFSNGCHFGTQAPDSQNRTPTADQSTRLHDWNQAITSRGGIAVTNSGFGIFETEVVGYGEQLQQLFVEALSTAPNASLALAQAKRRYLATVAVHDPYSYKTVQQLSMYGLGLLRMADAAPPSPVPAPPDTTAIDVSTGDLAFATTTSERGTIVDVVEHPTAVDTTPLAVNGRPVTPRLTLEVPLPEGRASAGVWITGLRSRLVEDVDPVVARLGISRTDRDTESQTRHTIFPTTPVSVVDADGVARVTYPVGSFSSGEPVDGRVRGTLRLDERVDADLLLRDAGEQAPAPSITRVTTAATPDGTRVVVNLLADETTRPNVRAAVLGRDDLGRWTYGELARGADGRWTGSIPLSGGATRLVELLGEVYNGDDVGYWRNKGEPPRQSVELFDGVDVVLSSADGRHANGVFLGDVQGTVVGSPGVVYTLFDGDRLLGTVGDGGTFTLDGDGGHELVVEGSDGSVALVPVVIDGSTPTIDIVSPSEGTVVGVGARLELDVRCLDTGTGADCTTTVDGTPIADGALVPTDRAGDHTVVVTAVDGVGRQATASRTYTVESLYVASEFFSPIKPRPQLNTVSPNSSIAVKFTVTDPEGNAYSDPAIIESRTWVPIHCRTHEVTGAPFTTAGTVPTYSGFFHFNTDAPSAVGCYELVVTLDDGTPLGAYFEVKSTGGGKK